MSQDTYPLSPEGVFATVNGEGRLCGLPMIFVRLAGCSIGCNRCDTNYAVHRRATAEEIAQEVAKLCTTGVEWIFCTGGEPTDHDLAPLLRALRQTGLRLALATAGTRKVQRGVLHGGWDFVSVSPHHPERWAQRSGDQLNLVPGLNGFGLADFAGAVWDCHGDFGEVYVTPCAGKPETLAECLAWVNQYPGFRLGWQAHKQWGLP